MNKYKEGDKVILPAFEEEGNSQPREIGKVLEVERGKMYVVEVDTEDPDDDGIREVHEDNIEGLAP